ncbi:MAG TPA: hypothetical protein VFC44_06110 [Candidatus Saccharimonadales bacterium]|nr:hypothetical protein [Candidatus Saccharimonadales bacterium]
MNKILDKIAAIGFRFNDLRAEQISLGRKEAEQKEEIARATADAPLDDPKVARRVHAARGMLDIIAGRLAHVENQLKPIIDEMRQAFEEAEHQWTFYVRRQGDAIEARFYKAILPFWSGDEKEARHALSCEHLPLWHENNRRLFLDTRRLDAENAVQLIGSFIAKVEAHMGDLDIS